ncbi:hypothetical protein P280DRAFT_5259 [Massarina eburnea CBS 473.64]|uniref:LIM zinc-binding domain-containing protein n=1 Tax=Massarina eburnea CBS 473.64 TaxID=1395130 RepID=A0A6A6SJ45_9PLEO|nr:hypothetical protein P280DRAFT_5259 [Massarina eburnea CBS 473.64]
MEAMSLLPMIKCSSCGAGIDITQLADHVCAPAAPGASQPPKLDRAATFGGAATTKLDAFPRPPGRGPNPLRVDSQAANKPFRMPASQLSPSPLSPGGRTINRSVTNPLPEPNAPPSPDLMTNMDSPFPRIPANQTRTPTSAKPRPMDRSESYQSYAQPNPLFAPRSPRIDAAENVLKRMNTMSPGPFDVRGYDSRPGTSSGPLSPESVYSDDGQRRMNTQSSMKGARNGRTSMASNASSVFSNSSSGLPSRPKPGMVGAMLPPPPPVPPVEVEEKTEGIDAFLARLQKETMGPSKGARSNSPMRQDDRSRSPMRPDLRSKSPMQQGSIDKVIDGVQRQSRPLAPRATSRRPPSLRTSDPPNPAMNDNRPRSNKDLPPLPALSNFAGQPIPTDPVYTPSDSGHSEDSYASSGFRSVASSRSSPPTSEAGNSRQGSKIRRPDYTDEPVQRTLSPETFADARIAPTMQPDIRRANENYNRPQVPEAMLRPQQMPTTPQTPLDPAIQRGLSYEKRREEARSPIDPALKFAASPPPPRMPPSEPRREMERRPTTSGASKGRCRGCGEAITGKSVKDSSGRLSGRYHKECFVCHTCRNPFPTAEFYVFENAPYCHQHYHVLNGSLCRTCNRGIEGQYLETDQRLKFHPKCFTCFTCRIVLRDDYYEVGRRNFCERHAYAAVNQRNNMLGAPPGGGQNKNLQKRRTRMMMMR